jgi:response regulator NasT
MSSALIVCDSPKGTEFFRNFLVQNFCQDVTVVTNGQEARRSLINGEYDVCVINAPISGESGEQLAIDLAEKNVCQVILFVKVEYMEEVTEQVEDFGVITVSKPISKQMFWSALKLAKVAQNRISMARKENNKLRKKLEDVKIISRAKCVLISYLGMSEEEAHKYIEKQAMDMRLARIDVAKEVLRKYE